MDQSIEALITARQRPVGRAILTQKWDNLLFLHWKYDAAEIQRRLPPGLFVDTFNGQAFLSIIGFQMSAIRVSGLPAVPFLSNLTELNVRTYVRTADGKPGIYFFSLDCDHWLAVKIAQLAFGLNYKYAQLKFLPNSHELSCQRSSAANKADYSWEPQGSPGTAAPGTIEFFLLERYIFFTERKKQLWAGQVYHPPYSFSSASVTEWSEAPFQWNQLLPTHVAPDLVHACRGVAIEAFPLTLVHA